MQQQLTRKHTAPGGERGDESWYVDCFSCGKQVSINSPDDDCYFCGWSACKKALITPGEIIIKKENIMPRNEETVERSVVPARPKKRKELRKYFEKNKEAILADYLSLGLRDFFKRWGIATNTWAKLKKEWGVQNKLKTHRSKDGKKPQGDDTQVLTEHERYLVLVGYQQAVREFLKAGMSAN